MPTRCPPPAAVYALFIVGVVISLLGLVVIATASMPTPEWLRDSVRSFRTSKSSRRSAAADSSPTVAPAAAAAAAPDGQPATATISTGVELAPTRSRLEHMHQEDHLVT